MYACGTRGAAMKLTKLAVVVLLGVMLISGVACDEGELAEPTPTPTPTLTCLPRIPATPPSQNQIYELQVHFIDVGQGDAILIDAGDYEVLIDGGDRSPGIIDYLEDRVNGSIELLIATNPHADHIGGLIEVLQTFDVNEIWLNGDTATSATYSDFMDLIEEWSLQTGEPTLVELGEGPCEPRRGFYTKRPVARIKVHPSADDWHIVDDIFETLWLEFNVLHPVEPLSDDINNNSMVLQITWDDIDFLFMSDAEVEAEQSMIDAGVLSDIEVLKVGHHGSSSSSSQEFLDIVQPEFAIYMAGEGNQYGHPHEETIIALDNTEAWIYGTDVHGTIVLSIIAETDGQLFGIGIEKGSHPDLTTGGVNK
jgi:competence protein ComEC